MRAAEKELPPGVILCRRRTDPLRSEIMALYALGGPRCQVSPVRALLDGFKAQVDAFGAQMRRPIQPELNLDFVLGHDTDGLFLEQLKELVLEAEGVVVGDRTLGAPRQDLIEAVLGEQRPVSIGIAGRIDGEAHIVIVDVDGAQEDVSRLHVVDVRQTQFFDESILMRVEAALDAPLGLRAVGEDDLDAKFGHRPRELRDGVFIAQFLVDGCLSIDLVDRVLVDVKSDGTAVFAKIYSGAAHEVKRILDFDELGMEDAGCRVVDVDEQGAFWAASLKPIVIGTVELDEHADTGPALTPIAVLGLRTMALPEAGLAHPFAHRRVAHHDAVQAFELLLGEDGGKPLPARIVERAEGHAEQFWVALVVRTAPEEPVEDPAVAAASHLGAQPADLALADV